MQKKCGEKKEVFTNFARLGPATCCLRIPFKESEHHSSAHMFLFFLCFLWVTNPCENGFELRPQGKMPHLISLYFVTLKKGFKYD